MLEVSSALSIEELCRNTGSFRETICNVCSPTARSQRKSRAGERMPRHFKPQVGLPGRDTALKPMIDSPVIFADIAMGCAPDFFLLHVHQH
jgi:hypothetical protein